MKMSPRQLASISSIHERHEKEQLAQGATANRLGQADKKSWNKAMKEISK